jgi:hypothetical protein
MVALVSFALKIVFQFISIFPAIGKIAFGFRPIVIGYLHLVLLGLMTTFIMGYLKKEEQKFLANQNLGLVVFVSGIVLNEFALFFQGLTGILGIYIPGVNELLFVIALILLGGVAMILGKAGEAI